MAGYGGGAIFDGPYFAKVVSIVRLMSATDLPCRSCRMASCVMSTQMEQPRACWSKVSFPAASTPDT